jgi:hypothetical protein
MTDKRTARVHHDELRDMVLTKLVKEFVAADIAEKLRTGELTVVRTDPDGTRWYQKTAELRPVNEPPQ